MIGGLRAMRDHAARELLCPRETVFRCGALLYLPAEISHAFSFISISNFLATETHWYFLPSSGEEFACAASD
jgi:hypothetical protein